jgi:hypothetical protein
MNNHKTGQNFIEECSPMDDTAFREEQKIVKVWWTTLIIVAIAVFIWYSFIQQIILGQPFGTNPGPDWMVWLLWVVFGIGLPIVWYMTKLIVEVKEDHLLIRYFPLTTRKIPFSDIKQVESRTYKPVREYGGWGLRGWGNKRAYNVSGDQGVELELQDGRMIMIGSQKPEELALALETKIK